MRGGVFLVAFAWVVYTACQVERLDLPLPLPPPVLFIALSYAHCVVNILASSCGCNPLTHINLPVLVIQYDSIRFRKKDDID